MVVKKKHKTQFKLLDPFTYFKEEEMIVGDGKPWRAPEGDYMAQDIPEWMPENVLSMIDYRYVKTLATLPSVDMVRTRSGKEYLELTKYFQTITIIRKSRSD